MVIFHSYVKLPEEIIFFVLQLHGTLPHRGVSAVVDPAIAFDTWKKFTNSFQLPSGNLT